MTPIESLARLAEAEAQLNAAAPLGNSDIEEDSFANAIAATDFAALLEYVKGVDQKTSRMRGCLGFFASVIKSGEPWTSSCESRYNEALAPTTDNGERG